MCFLQLFSITPVFCFRALLSLQLESFNIPVGGVLLLICEMMEICLQFRKIKMLGAV